jgi:hypothetical protein
MRSIVEENEFYRLRRFEGRYERRFPAAEWTGEIEFAVSAFRS